MEDLSSFGTPVEDLSSFGTPVSDKTNTPLAFQENKQEDLSAFGTPAQEPRFVDKAATSVLKGAGDIIALPHSMVKLMGTVKDLTTTWANSRLNPDTPPEQDTTANVIGDLVTFGLGSKPVQNFADKNMLSAPEAQDLVFKDMNAMARGLATGLGAQDPGEAKPADFTSPVGKMVGAGIEGAVGGAALPFGLGSLKAAAIGATANAAQQGTEEATKGNQYSTPISIGVGLATGLLTAHYLTPSSASSKISQTVQKAAEDASAVPPPVRGPYVRPDDTTLAQVKAEIDAFDQSNMHFSFGDNKSRPEPYAGAVGTNDMETGAAKALEDTALKDAAISDNASSAFGGGMSDRGATIAKAIQVYKQYGPDTIQALIEDGHNSPTTLAAARVATIELSGEKSSLMKLAAVPDHLSEQYGTQLNQLTQRQTEFMQAYNPVLSNVGRTLNAQYIPFTIDDFDQFAQQLKKLGVNNADTVAVNKLTQKFVEDKFASLNLGPEGKEPSFWDKFMEFRRGNLLSSLKSTVRVVNSMAVMSAIKEFEYGLETGVGKIRSTITGGEAGRSFQGFQARNEGFVKSIMDSMSTFANAIRDENYVPRFERTGEAITNIPQYGQAIPGVLGKAVRFGGRGILAADKSFDQIAINRSLNEQIYNEAQRQITAGRDLQTPGNLEKFIDNLKSAPPSDFLAKARDEGLIVNLKEAAPRTIENIIYGKGAISKGLQFFFPFPRIIYNAFKQGAIRVPGFGLLMPTEYKALMAGGKAMDGVISRQIFGTAAAGVIAGLYNQGYITGASQGTYTNQSNIRANGVAWQPNSFWDGSKYVSWENIEPFNTFTPLILGGYDVYKTATGQQKPIDLVQAIDHAAGVDDALSALWHNAISHHLYMQQFTDIVDGLNTQQGWGKFNYVAANAVAGTIVPRIINDLRIASDPTVRLVDYGTHTRDLPEAILEKTQSQIPGMSKSLAPRVDLIGRPVLNTPPLGEKTVGNYPSHLLMPFHYNDNPSDPALTELNRYGLLEDKATGQNGMAPPSRTWNGYRMTNDQLSKIDQLYGEQLKKEMDQAINTGNWERLNNQQRLLTINKFHTAASNYAKRIMLSEDPDLKQAKINQNTVRKTATPNTTGQGFINPTRLNSYRP